MSLDAIRYAWPEILIRAKAALPPVAALLDRLQPQAFAAGRLAVALTPDVGDQVAALTPDRLAALASAVEQEIGLDVIVVSLEWAEGETGPAPASPDPDDAPSPDPEPADNSEPDPSQEGKRIRTPAEVAADARRTGRPPTKAPKVAKSRDPLADMEGERIRFNLLIQKPPGKGYGKMAPWSERRGRREKMVRQRRAARTKAEAEAARVAPVENETPVQTDSDLIDSAEGAAE